MCADATPRHTDLKAVVLKTKVSLFCCQILWLKKSFSAVVEPAPRIRLYFCCSKCEKRAIACPRPAPTLLGQLPPLRPLPPWLRRPWLLLNFLIQILERYD